MINLPSTAVPSVCATRVALAFNGLQFLGCLQLGSIVVCVVQGVMRRCPLCVPPTSKKGSEGKMSHFFIDCFWRRVQVSEVTFGTRGRTHTSEASIMQRKMHGSKK